jgi:hypothetical protein
MSVSSDDEHTEIPPSSTEPVDLTPRDGVRRGHDERGRLHRRLTPVAAPDDSGEPDAA